MSAFYFYKVSDGLCAGIQIDSAVSSQRSLSSWINRTQCVFNFTWFCLSWVVNPIWVVVIWRQNLSFFFHLVLSLLGSQSYLGCSYLKAEPVLFFSPGSVSLGFSSYGKLILSMNCNIIKFTFGPLKRSAKVFEVSVKRSHFGSVWTFGLMKCSTSFQFI